MKLNTLRKLISVVTTVAMLSLSNSSKLVSAASLNLMGLTDDNTIFLFSPDDPSQVTAISVTGTDGQLIGIDIRSSDGLLYGITDTNNVYTIDPVTGEATLKSTLNYPFEGVEMSGFDFNPVPDRLRLVGGNNQNFRNNVDNGMVADYDANAEGLQTDKDLTYADGDPNAGADPHITAAAYTNSFPGPPSPPDVTPPTRTTQLFGIDSELDVLVLQNPPNDGVLQTIGSLGIDFSETGGFDIFSTEDGENVAFAASGSTVYSINLSDGSATPIGTIGDGNMTIIGLATALTP
ncbi:MAG: DUF4394 domain-containing protein [Cyanobacteria bacterium CRU_2_1]|nr:DUF4394 domain-containing protein [Cyanobacteria bacterium RU_5_0]NJR58612.1 DUF4394 domain-containing protein [Cyanobacteria bacterium CRU_2_1]